MSDKERPNKDDGNIGDGGGGGGGGGNDGEDEDEEGSKEKTDPEENKCGGCWRKRGEVSLFRWRRGKNPQNRRRKKKGVSVNSGCWGRSFGENCCLCQKQPRTVDSSVESPTSDPNSPAFTFGMLKTLIETNDFYSKDCNPHLDAV